MARRPGGAHRAGSGPTSCVEFPDARVRLLPPRLMASAADLRGLPVLQVKPVMLRSGGEQQQRLTEGIELKLVV